VGIINVYYKYEGGIKYMKKFNFYVTKYEGRILLIVENTIKNLVALFYRSTGSATPEIKKAGEVFPILGVLEEGTLGSEWSKYYPEMSQGWIIKAVKDGGRNDLRSYLSSENLKNFSHKLEKLINERENLLGNYEVFPLDFKQWIEKIDYFHINYGNNFYPTKLLNLAKGEKIGA
jgi:hypothetical protein